MKKSIFVLGILMFILLMSSTVVATSGFIFAVGGNASSSDSGPFIRVKDGFSITRTSGKISVNFRIYTASEQNPVTLTMDKFTGTCIILPLKPVFVNIFGFGRNIHVT
jgi:hypothetical protein